MSLHESSAAAPIENGVTAAERRRAVVAAHIGNALEWYDFIVYSFFAAMIGKLFFPATNPSSQLLLGLATFGVGFFMRPIGAVVLGIYSDRKGRRAALTMTIAVMMVGTAILVFVPTYAAIGVAAPVLVVIARLFQGFSAGGEFGGATSYLTEYSPPQQRGFYVSWQMSSQFMASLLGALVGTAVTSNLSPDELTSLGWRVPFVIGLLIGPVGIYIRARLEETPAFKAQPRAAESPLREVLRDHARLVACGFGQVVLGTVSVYVLVLFMPTYATRQFGLSQPNALAASALMSAVLVVLAVLAGIVSDRIGRKAVVLVGSVGLLVLVYPLFRFFAVSPSIMRLLAIEAVFAILIASFTSVSATFMAEMFPTRVRNTGLALSYNFAVAIFGGFGQFIVVWLIQASGDPVAPAYYVVGAAFVGTIAVLPLRDRTGLPLR
jgi:MFS transporter, MHS family, proline/betaine transporter